MKGNNYETVLNALAEVIQRRDNEICFLKYQVETLEAKLKKAEADLQAAPTQDIAEAK